MQLTWEEKYELAKEYYAKNGNLLIPRSYVVNNIRLGAWIATQRDFYKKGILSKDRIDLLEQINIAWTVLEKKRSSWNERYEMAKKYYKEHGNLLISQDYEIDGFQLGRWIHEQRQDKNNGILSSSHIDMLNDIKMVWNVQEYNWQLNYALAKKYYEEYHNLLIPKNYTVNNHSLGRWIATQKAAYRNNKITLEHQRLLENIGMIWNIDEYKWHLKYELAKKYYEEHQNLIIKDNKILEKWLSAQKTAYKKGKLSFQKIQLLENINMIWDLRDYHFKNSQIDTSNLKFKLQKLEKILNELLEQYSNDYKFNFQKDIHNIENEFILRLK